MGGGGVPVSYRASHDVASRGYAAVKDVADARDKASANGVRPGGVSIPAAFAASVKRNAERSAVRQSGRDTTYAELDERRREATRGLIAIGVKPGDRVAIWASNHLEWIVAGLALLSAGAVLTPIGTRLKGGEAGEILRRAGAVLLFCDAGHGGYDFVAAALAEECPRLRHIVKFGDDVAKHGRVLPWSNLLELGTSMTAADEVDRRVEEIAPGDLSDLLFTSGTSGKPKAVRMTHAQSLVACRYQALSLGAVSNDVLGALFPFAHNAGYRAAWQTALLVGMRIDPIGVVNVDQLLARIQDDKVTLLPAVPTVYQSLLEHPNLNDFDLSSLRVAMTGGTVVPVQLIYDIRDRLGVPHVVNAYGMTETAGNITYTRAGDPDEVVARTVGRPLDNLEVKIVDTEHRLLSEENVGQIAVRGCQVTQGYLDDPEMTSASFTADGFFLTGDVGYFRADGNLVITDRLKDMYICGGFNCYPAEIEEMLRRAPGVRSVAVIGVHDARMGEVGHAFVVAVPGYSLSDAMLIEWARANMAGYKVPRFVTLVEQLPLNALGKVDKPSLRARE